MAEGEIKPQGIFIKPRVITVNIQGHNSPCDLIGIIINLKENIDSSVLMGYIFH